MGKFDEAFSRGDLVRRIQALEETVELLMGGSRLTSSSIDEDGLSVKNGFIRWLDAEGNETARFATDGLSLTGLLEVIGNVQVAGDDGKIEILDANGNVQMTLSPDELSLTGILRILAGLLEWEDDASNVRMRIGQQGTNLWPDAESVRLIYSDAGGVQRMIVGEILDEGTGSLRGHGLLVQLADGTDLLGVWDGRAFLGAGDGSIRFEDGSDDELDLYDAAGNFRVTVGPVTTGGSPDGHGIFLTDGAGTDRFFASASRIWLRTTDGQQGNIEAGAVDSGGTGFRVLRIPN